MATVLITGGTGLIGKALTKRLISKGYQVIILTRGLGKENGNVSYRHWDVTHQTIDGSAIQQADYIVHLAGANVGEKRWTNQRKKEIVDSRVQSGQLLVKALRENANNVKAVISASAIGWYGPDPQVPNPNPFTETNAADTSFFLSKTCQQWEAAIQPVTHLGKRLVILRTGIVLSNEGGAYVEFKKPLRFGVASILGSGKQVVSWIHIDDIAGIYIAAIENEAMQGVYNAVTPAPITNKELIKTIAQHHKGFSVTTHVPELALKTVLGEMSIEILKSATVSSHKVQQAGYSFLFPTIDAAVADLEK